MVSQEEYEYSAFKCAFCKALNPSKKLRPIAPRLPMPVLSEPSDTSNKKIAEKPAQLPVPDKESGNFAHFDNSNWYQFQIEICNLPGSEPESASSNETDTLNNQSTEPKTDAIGTRTGSDDKASPSTAELIVDEANSQTMKSSVDKKNE